MQDTISPPAADEAASSEEDSSRQHLDDAIEFASNLLPISGPITAFAFLNALQALEDLPFAEGVDKGARLFGCQPYLQEEVYRQKFARGRIRLEDISAVLEEDLGDDADVLLGPLGTRHELRLAMLSHPLRHGPTEELRWFVAETDALTKMRSELSVPERDRFIEQTCRWVMRDLHLGESNAADQVDELPERSGRALLGDLVDHFGEEAIEQWSPATWEALTLQALWRICRQGVQGVDVASRRVELPIRHRDLLLSATGEDSDALVHDVMIRFCAAWADQGFAHWPLPDREAGFFKSFCALYRQSGGPPDRWLAGLARELERIHTTGMGPLECVQESLRLLGVEETEWDDFIPATMLALRGWASMIRQMEVRGDRVPLPAPKGTMIEFLAVRLILERLALAHVAHDELHYDGPLTQLRDEARSRIARPQNASVEQRAFLVFQLAQLIGWTPPCLYRLSKSMWSRLVEELEAFDGLERRRILHSAFERRFRISTLDAIGVHAQRTPQRVQNPRFQAAFCIDAREESFRRHLEETSPDVETFGTAGFYSVAMYYRGIADAHYAALCPVVIMPQHWVVEDVVYTLEEQHRRRAKTRRAIGTASHQVQVGSRSIAGGALLTACLGVLATIPMVARVLFPRLTARIKKTAKRFVDPPPITRLRLERATVTPGKEEDQIGFSLDEMANIGERVLRDIGLTSNFARLMIFFGHGSFCLNNPHKSSYDCGACSGSPGSPNARALAAMLNDLRVREMLAQRGLEIPKETVFLGGLHNTCDDTVSFLDLDLLPKSHLKDFEAAERTLEEACERNAHERCRRFDSAPLNISLSAAHRHVHGRSEDLAQTRPEFGNATNALCVVGRRERTRGLYMDRRAFMQSYDPTTDDADSSILARILSAVIPVCEGINLTYFFSYVDSQGYGCGTKLPHNVTSLLGVMDGTASDLRLGLPWQSVEIHEPMRCLFVIETTPEAMFHIMSRNPLVRRIIVNGWVQLAVLDPNSSQLRLFKDGEFHLYQPESTELAHADSSIDWYRGWRDHLGFAQIQPAS